MTSVQARNRIAMLASVLVIFGVVIAGCANPATGPQTRAHADEIERHLADREYWASPNRLGLQAPNRRHGLRTYFTRSGIRVVDRHASDDTPLLAMRLSAWGRPGAITPVREGALFHEKERVEIHRAELVEWFVNGSDGLEHGFTVESRPEGEGPLAFDLAIDAARLRLAGNVVRIETEAGRALRYGKLVVNDATGDHVDAHFALPAPGLVRLVVADADAVYPLTIDPLLEETADAQVESDQLDANLGFHVAGAGDVNGDGYADVIVGAPLYDAGEADEGAAFVFLGSASGVSGMGPLDAATQLESNQTGSAFGESVASAGDVNGDGHSDVVVGAHDFDGGSQDEGAAFVFLGSASGIASGGPASAATQLESDQIDADFGRSVASAGDIDQDGYADLIVGAPRFDAGLSDEGAAFVYRGSASGIASGGIAMAATQLEGDLDGALYGYSVASAGDVNGDGFGDVIVGAYRYEFIEREGAAFVHHGSASGILSGGALTAATILESNQKFSRFGFSVASMGDTNGDGYADVVVGAPLYDAGGQDAGVAFLVQGSASGVPSGDPAGTGAARIEAKQAGAQLGFSVAPAGDVNGDGYGDVAIGSPEFDQAGLGPEGVALVYLGGAAGIASGDTSDAVAKLESGLVGAQLGFSVAGAGDVNGDGYADVIAGAPSFDAGEAGEGIAIVSLGGAVGIRDTGAADADTELTPDQPGAQLGYIVAGAGDVNGDGYGDVIVAAPDYDAGEMNEGAVFVFLGSASGIATVDTASAHATIESDEVGARMGFAVASAGDVDGDGYGDIIVGFAAQDAALLFLGGPAGIGDGNPGDADAFLSLPGTAFGVSVASAGDVNGDGFGDLIVGATSFADGESAEGAALVYLGEAAGIADPSTPDITIEANQASARIGSVVASAGDVNGDGYGDVIVTNSQDAYIFEGSASGPGGDLASADTHLDVSGTNIHAAAAGDIDGDGYGDVIVGDRFFDNDEFNEGGAFVFLGSSSGVVPTPHVILESDQEQAQLGQSVAGAGDVNGDGYADVIVGAFLYNNGETDEGAAFVFTGSAAGIPDGTPAAAHARIESDITNSIFGRSVAGAGDVNGDGFSDVIVGAPLANFANGAAFVFHGEGGRPAAARQLRGPAAGEARPVAPWGSSEDSTAFRVSLDVASPRGRELAKLEVEVCPAGSPFADAACIRQVSSSWSDLGTTGAVLEETVPFAEPTALHHWRARALYAPLGAGQPGVVDPPHPPHGPWRRHTAQTVEADLRPLPEPGFASLFAAIGLIALLRARRGAPRGRDTLPRGESPRE